MAKITQTAGRNALGEFAPEFAHFNDDVLFGENWNNQDIDVKTRKVWTVNEGDLPYEDKAMRAHAKEMVFPIGTPNNGFAQYFSGRSFLAPVSTSQVGIFNVTFEPGCRNNWHIHHAKNGGGQILVCVAGRGYYQEEGKEAIEMKPGDCINIPAEVKHWHGAAADSWFSHLAVEVPGEETSNEWCEPVSDEEYGKLK
jgi:4-carboxymuconolactone decarboxylase